MSSQATPSWCQAVKNGISTEKSGMSGYFPLAVIILLSLLLRMLNIFSSLEYDEIWSWENFSNMPVKEIMTRLALPNNQPLNSLLIKITLPFAAIPQFIRWHSLLAGLLTVPLVGYLAGRLSKSKLAGYATMFFMALSPAAVVYSQLARGYSLQLAFLLLYGCGFATFNENKPRKQIAAKAAILAGGIGAIITVSSSVMFLLPLLFVLWQRNKFAKLSKSMGGILTAGAIFTIAYYLGNYEEISAGRIWGIPIKSFGEFINFSGDLLARYLPFAWMPLIILGMIAPQNRCLFWLILIPLALAPLTNGGPARVYLPFTAVLAVWAGSGGIWLYNRAVKRQGKIMVVAMIIILGFAGFSELYPQWKTVDYPQVYTDASRQFPPSDLLIFPATSTYTIAWNSYPVAGKDFQTRINQNQLNNLIMFGGEKTLNGSSRTGNETSISLDFTTSKITGFPLPGWKYRLTPLNRELCANDVVLALAPDGDPQKISRFFQLIDNNDTGMQLNVFLAPHVPYTPGDNRRFGAFAFKVKEPALIELSTLKSNFNIYLISGSK